MNPHPHGGEATRLLVVDDEPANRALLEATLAEPGCEVVCCASGPQALAALAEGEFALVLLDVQMPGMSGLETARRMRAEAASRHTPIIFLTASRADEVDVEAGYSLGAVDYLIKPVAPGRLEAKVAVFIELDRSRRLLSRERSFLAAVLESVEDGVVACDADGVLTLFNRATRIFHALPEAPLPPERWAEHYALYRPDGKTPLPVSEIPLFRALAGEVVRDAGMVIAARGHAPRTVVASGRALYGADGRKLGAVVSMHEITSQTEIQAAREASRREQQRREDAEAAAQANAKFRTFFDQGSYFAGLMALDGTILEANRLWVEGCGFERSQVIGRAFWDCGWWGGADDLMAMVRSGTAEAALGQTFRRESRYHLGDGSERSIDLVLTPVLDQAGKVLFIAPTGTDNTDRKRDEEALRRLAFEMSEADRRKNEFLATLAHELRNPLAPLQNGLSIMRQAAGDAEATASARAMMERQLAHMVRLVNDLLDIARISSGKLDLRLQRIDLAEVVHNAVETSAPLIEARGHSLHLVVPTTALRVEADPTRLAQVIGNLLGNAAKYTEPGGRITLTVSGDDADTDGVLIEVQDSGIGIDPDSLATVFDMFTQVGRGYGGTAEGLGIGLSLVRRLVELHGGTVSAHSDGLGQGSRFALRLPLAPGETPPPRSAAAAATEDAAGSALAPLRILVVDDNTDAADSLAALLSLDGRTAEVANDGPEALRVARSFLPQVVFLDIGLPGKNGYEVAQEMRRLEGMEDALLVALTGWGADTDRSRSRAAGIDHHLTKPAEFSEIDALLARQSALLATRALAASSAPAAQSPRSLKPG